MIVTAHTIEENTPYSIYPCLKCGKQYYWKGNLQKHVLQECGKQPKYKCVKCVYITKYKSNFIKHLILKHNNSLSSLKIKPVY